MRNVRAAVAASLILSVFAALSSGPVAAAPTGVGTASAETTVVGVELGAKGSLLGVKLLGDSARSTIDPKTAAVAEAFSKFTGVNVSSTLVAALNKGAPAVESRQPGGEKEVTRGSVNLSHPSTDPDVTIPPSVLAGTIGFASLNSEAAPDAAKSSLSASLTNATVAGALATVKGVSSSLTTSASSTASEATRSVKVDEVVVLDLSALLEGLDLSLLDLAPSVVLDLLEALEETVPGFPDAAAVKDKVDALNDAVDAVQTELTTLGTATGSLTTTAVTTVVNTINTVGLGAGVGELVDPADIPTITTVSDLVAELNAVLDDLQSELTELLSDVLAVLDGAPLLTVDGAEANVVTKATDTLANSVATTTAKVGSVSVGAKPIAGVDIKEAIATIEATEKTIDDTVSTVTTKIHPDLAGLVTVDLFAPADGAGKSSAGGYVKAVEGVTVLTAKVTPPAALATIVNTVKATVPSIGQEIDALNGPDPVPQVAAEMKALESTLGGGTQAVGEGGTFRVAHVLGTSEFAVGASGFPGSGINPGPGTGTGTGTGPGTPGEADRTLPATGRNSTLPLTALATLLVALGLGFRHWVHMPARALPLRTRTR